jgi:hypothetical protein
MFLIDIPFKGCQGRSNHSSIAHAVSYFACGIIDTACIVHAVSLTPHAFFIFLHTIAVLHMILTFWSCSKKFVCMRYQWHRMHTCMRYQWYRKYFCYEIPLLDRKSLMPFGFIRKTCIELAAEPLILAKYAKSGLKTLIRYVCRLLFVVKYLQGYYPLLATFAHC